MYIPEKYRKIHEEVMIYDHEAAKKLGRQPNGKILLGNIWVGLRNLNSLVENEELSHQLHCEIKRLQRRIKKARKNIQQARENLHEIGIKTIENYQPTKP
jgi:hypothetical protein